MTSKMTTNLYWNLWKLIKLHWIKYVLRLVWVFLNNLYCIPVYLFYMLLLLPLFPAAPSLYWLVEETLFSWLLSMVACWNWTAGYDIAESGESFDELAKQCILLMPNHQSTADVPMCFTFMAPRYAVPGRVMWIMDKIFKFTNFGICSWIHDDYFILAGKENRESTLTELGNHLRRVFIPKKRKYLVLFPEGGFLRKRRAISHSFAKKKDLPILNNVTLPRTGALDMIMSVLGPGGDGSITRLVDVTVAYPEGRPLCMPSIAGGWRQPCTTHVHYRSWPVDQLPQTSDELFKWMVKLYEEKEAMLGRFYETGKFPYNMFDENARPPTVLQHSSFRFFVLHLFFIFSTYLMCASISVLRNKVGV